ncbi:MAG: energy transducer TonB [Asticcacaulis sp.]
MNFHSTTEDITHGAQSEGTVSLIEQRLSGKTAGRKTNGAAIAIGISLAIHGALAVYLVTTRYIIPAPEVQETEAILVSMGPMVTPQPDEKPQPPRPPVESKPIIQPRPTPTPLIQQVPPLPLPPIKPDEGPPAPPVQGPVAVSLSARAPAAVAGPQNDFVGVDVDMALTNNPPPAYPPQAKARHEQGTVILRLQVRGDGSVGDIQVRTSSGSMRLDQAATDAVRRWKFKPATQGGRPVDSWAVVPITFGFKKAGDRRRPDRGRPGGADDRDERHEHNKEHIQGETI